jgi:hypothetical protein
MLTVNHAESKGQPMQKKRAKTRPLNTISLRDTARVKRLRAAAKLDGLGALSLSALLRVILDGWCEDREREARKP